MKLMFKIIFLAISLSAVLARVRLKSKQIPFQERIVGGHEAEKHQFPHQVAIVINTTDFCGGSIIRSNVILTAARCVDGVDEVIIIAGAHNLLTSEDTRQYGISNKFVIHEKWDPYNIVCDIALIILPDVFDLNDYVKEVSLYERSTALTDIEATVSGWGWKSDNTQYINNVLLYATSKIISNSECKDYYPNKISWSVMCFDGKNDRSICNGDAGSALLVIEDNQVFQVGVASFGSTLGCEKGEPSVFSRVSSFVDWINKKLL